MATLGRPKAEWKSYPTHGDAMTAPQAAKFLGMKLNTLHQQLIRDRGLCMTDGHAKKVNGRWEILPSIKEAFEQSD